jgi:hypothetical protein
MKTYLIDAGERVAATFAAGMLAVIGTTGQDLTNWAVWQGGALAGALSVVKALAARYTGDKDKASLL